MGLTDQIMEHGGGVIGTLTKKLGLGADQVKGALDKIVPFVQQQLGQGLSLPGRGAALLGQIKQHDLKAFASDPVKLAGDDADRAGAALLADLDPAAQDAHVAEVAQATGLDAATVRALLPAAAVATAGAMDADGHLEQILDGQTDLMAKLAQIQADAKAGKYGK